MAACLSLNDFVASHKVEVERTWKVAHSLDPKAPESCGVFGQQVRALGRSLDSTYRAAALLARRTERVAELAEIWKAVSVACDEVLGALKSLKDDYPGCGTPELYDLALDYKSAASKRYELNREAIEWSNEKMPDRLFPETT
jgi:hypothetical protein